jgi:chromosome segregation ATPase
MAEINAEQIRQELEQAREELRSLETEAGHLDEAEREAIQQDHDERMKAARSGGKIMDAITRRRSKQQEVCHKREQLPYAIHSARIRVAELQLEHAEALLPEAEKRVEETSKALGPADVKFAKAQAENKAIHDEYGSALAERSMVENAKRDAELELARLERVGPEVAVTVPQSPNAL